MGSRFLTGTLRSWRDQWGFIQCPEAFSGDLFAHKQNFVGAIPVGDLTGCTVRFVRATDAKGRPHAEQISVLAPDRHGSRRLPPPLPLHSRQPLPQTQELRANASKLEGLVGTKLRGEIRKWKDDWGFIISPKFEGDLFVHRQSLLLNADALEPGKKVSFTVALDKRDRPTAAEVSEPDPAPEDFVDRELLRGQIKSWRKDWGFIVAPDHFQGDLFCHQEELQLDGQTFESDQLERAVRERLVEFQVSLDKRGRACARNVVFVEGLEPGFEDSSKAAAGGEEMEGTLRSWRDPWGFIVSPENFNGDLFCHGSCFLEPPPQGMDLTGARVRFVRENDDKGRPRAIQVLILEHPGLTQDIGGPENAGMARAASVPTDPKFSSCIGRELQGQVRSWKEEWGFIIAPDHFEGDLFVHKGGLENGLDELTPGVYVTFEVGADSKGRAAATRVRCASEAKDWAGSGARLSGSIRSFKHPWGFMVSPNSFVGDLFFHMGSFVPAVQGELRPGQQVSFVVQEDKNGKATARDINLEMPRPAKRSLVPNPPPLKRPRK